MDTNDPRHRALVSVRVIQKAGEPATMFARAHKAAFATGWSFDVKEPEITGAETLLGLLAADVISLFRGICRNRQLGVDEIETAVKAELADPLVHLGVIGAVGEPRYESFSVKAYVGTSAGVAAVTAAWDEAVRRAPLANTLRRAAALEISCQIV